MSNMYSIMKSWKYIFISVITILCICSKTYATDSIVKNLGFESGTFSGWIGYTWLYYGTDNGAVGTTTSKVQVSLPTSRRQVIMTDTTAYDANTGGLLRKIPKGYRYSARLGDEIISSDGKPRGWEQSLQYKLSVDSTNSLLIMKFACVLQYASDHTALQEPRFKLILYDKSGNTINTCSNYDVYSSSGNVSGFQTYTPSGSSTPVKWRNWTTVGADLSAYKGQNITIEFMSADCSGQYHYGYAYFVAETHPMYITSKYCSGDSVATLIAPEGFVSYAWNDSKGVSVGTSQILKLTKPIEGATYSCNMVSATGCQVALTTIIARYDPNAEFNFTTIDCNKLTNTVQFTNPYTPTHGTFTYKWNFGDGTISTEKNPLHVYKSSGVHTTSLVVSNPPSLCTDSVSKIVETFYPPLIGISGDSTYCPNNTTKLKGVGAYRYEWSTGSKAESIEVGKDVKIWMIGYSSKGCYTDTIRLNVTQEPDWTFKANGDLIYCAGGSSTLTAEGAASYRWSSGQTTSSITVRTPGQYTVIGANPRGCEKSKTFIVVEDPLPQADFSTSRSTVDTRHNTLVCSTESQSNVQYSWNMGDSLTETGSSIQHTYNISPTIMEYKVVLTATNENGCTNSTLHTIDVVPFIPNVFTPNSDGVNDLFAAGFDLEVFERNGTKLYKGNTGWNGKYNGRVMDNDTYFYLIYYTDKNNQQKQLKGYFTLTK